MIKPNQVGDTIVEVLIVIAIMSAVLAAAFATSNNSLLYVQDAQEHSEAEALVTGQLDKLKELALLSSITDNTIFVSTPFCINPQLKVIDLSDHSNASQCAFKSNGTQAPAGFQPAYALKDTQSDNLFTVSASWDSLNGPGQNNVTMYYRVYK